MLPAFFVRLPAPCAALLLAALAASAGAQEGAPPSPETPPAETASAPEPGPNSEPATVEDPAAAPAPDAPARPAEDAVEPAPAGDLFELGQQLFETFAPEEIKERYRFPTREEWDAFAGRLEEALQSPSLARLAEMEPDTRAALVALRALPDYAEYADWLEERLDDIHVAQQAAARPAAPSAPEAAPTAPDAAPLEPWTPPQIELPADEPEARGPLVPLYDLWLARMRERKPPERAGRFVSQLKPVFEQAALPPALVWIAETESSFNPAARSPVGARGLFQLMPGTAKDLGLRLFPFDERLDPVKNASSAARYLSRLHARFQDWPLALAAYNAGPARVSRTLKQQGATTFAEIADALPSETRLYVPKVLATIAVREGVTPRQLAAVAPSE